jgi:glutamine amidotransferase
MYKVINEWKTIMIAIIDYDAGNLTSVARALNYIGFTNQITNDIGVIKQAERIIFPGVGAAGSAMESLKRLGLDHAIKIAFETGKPILGICLGTQIIMGQSEENNTPCLGLVSGAVRAFTDQFQKQAISGLKIPHMGWNRIKAQTDHPLFAGLTPKDEFYFVHSYYPEPEDNKAVLAATEYGITFPSVIGRANLIATQFHLEKSGRPGLTLLKNFCEWQPC